MNDRKRAWQILHTEIRRRAADLPADEAWSLNVGNIIKHAHSSAALIIELAGFGATFAVMGRDPEHASALADAIGVNVFQESDDEDDDDDEDDL